jgi:predicted GIY-YIG superfamily endonuclease
VTQPLRHHPWCSGPDVDSDGTVERYETAVWGSASLSPIHRIVALCYARRICCDRRAWVSIGSLMSSTGIKSRSTACGSVAFLTRSGWLEQSGTTGDHNNGTIYRICIPESESPRRPRVRDGLTVLYRWFDADGRLLYIGITNDLANRTEQHAESSEWFPFAAALTVWIYPDRASATSAETSAIKAEYPLFNIDKNEAVCASDRLSYLSARGAN